MTFVDNFDGKSEKNKTDTGKFLSNPFPIPLKKRIK